MECIISNQLQLYRLVNYRLFLFSDCHRLSLTAIDYYRLLSTGHHSLSHTNTVTNHSTCPINIDYQHVSISKLQIVLVFRLSSIVVNCYRLLSLIIDPESRTPSHHSTASTKGHLFYLYKRIYAGDTWFHFVFQELSALHQKRFILCFTLRKPTPHIYSSCRLRTSNFPGLSQP